MLPSPFRIARWLGALLLALAVALMLVLPQTAGTLPPGFRTPILAFELAASRAEVEALFGPPGSELRAALTRRMDLGNTIDFGFMVAYGALLASVAMGIARDRGRPYLVAAMLAPIAALCDAAENLQLFAITRTLGGNYDESLGRLAVFTSLKWGLLALALASLSPALLRGTRTEKVVGVLCAATGALFVGAWVDRTHFVEAFALSMSLGFVGLWVVALRRHAPS